MQAVREKGSGACSVLVEKTNEVKITVIVVEIERFLLSVENVIRTYHIFIFKRLFVTNSVVIYFFIVRINLEKIGIREEKKMSNIVQKSFICFHPFS